MVAFSKIIFSSKTEWFFRFRTLVSPIGAVRTVKALPFPGQKNFEPEKKLKATIKILFSVRFQKNVFSLRSEQIVFSFSPWFPLKCARTENKPFLGFRRTDVKTP